MKFENITSNFTPEDIKANKGMAVVSIIGILWIIPLIQKTESPFVKHYMNIGVWMTILGAAYGVLKFIPYIGGILALIVSILLTILGIISLVFAITDKAYDLPLISMFKIFN